MLTRLFSKRRKAGLEPETPIEISVVARNRILCVIQDIVYELDRHEAFGLIYREIWKKYGSISCGPNGQPDNPVDAAWEHFVYTDDDKVIDFLEMLFRIRKVAVNARRNQLIDDINEIFEEEGVSIEFSPYEFTSRDYEEDGHRRHSFQIDKFPNILFRMEEAVQSSQIRPALAILGRSEFLVANEEMLAAHDHLRHRRFEDALTSCASSFESFLKTICHIKKWQYDPQKNTASNLVQICKAKNLFPDFYENTFIQIATVRNKLSSSHGRGPAKVYSPSSEHVEHLIQVASSNMILLAKLAGIKSK